MDNDLICVAICRRPQGIKGEIRISVLLDNVKTFQKLQNLNLKTNLIFTKC